jgi:NADH-quinone oxidoreductase subunit J
MKISILIFLLLFSVFFSFLVISLRNTVYAVFSLIFVFLCAFGVLLCIGVSEFLAVVILIVYVGAVAILFLFTVMMLGTGTSKASSFDSLKEEIVLIFKVCFIFYAVFSEASIKMVNNNLIHFRVGNSLNRDFEFLNKFYSNDIKIFGELLYVKHVELFFLITFVLFVTLIGSLVLSLCYYKPTTNKDFIKN